jgi:hypothetical protein
MVFQSNFPILHFHQHLILVNYLHPCQHFFSIILVTGILVNAKWYHIVVLFDTSLVADNIENVFIWLLAILIYSLE